MITRSSSIQFDLQGTQFQDYNKDRLLFFDIETTGFVSRTSFLYLIGAVSWDKDHWTCTQWFAETPNEEVDVLKTFLQFAKSFTQYIHFNGDRFDIPYLNDKCKTYHLESSLTSIVSRDLMRMIRPLKKLLQLPALNQRSLEEFIGYQRKDLFDGGELIPVYQKYTEAPTEDALNCMLRHNYDDLCGLIALIPILTYQNIPNGTYQINNAEINGDDLLIHMWMPLCLPKPFTYPSEFFSLHGESNNLALNINGYRGALKYFFADYKNYYYLPAEDMAIHKSVAAFVDKSHREPAKASTCYNKKNGFYIPQNERLFTPIFKKNYSDSQEYFACSDAFLSDHEKLYVYTRHLLTDL